MTPGSELRHATDCAAGSGLKHCTLGHGLILESVLKL